MEPNEFAFTIIGDWKDEKTETIYQFTDSNTVFIYHPKANMVKRAYNINSLQGSTILRIGEVDYTVKSVTQDENFILTVCLISPVNQKIQFSKPF